MLNVFPELLSYGLLAPTIIRLIVAIVLLVIGWEILSKKRLIFGAYFQARQYPLPDLLPWKLGIAQIIAGLFLLFGFFTQVAALVAVYLLSTLFFIENRDEKILPYTSTFYLIMVVISITLLFSGAGAYSVDLPL